MFEKIKEQIAEKIAVKITDKLSQIKVIKCHDDDVIAAIISENLNDNEFECVMKQFRRAFPDNKLLILEGDWDINVITKKQIEQKANEPGKEYL